MARLVCTHCGSKDRLGLPGSGWIELALWLAWIVPGIIYSLWRRTGRPACGVCGYRALVSTASPLGLRLAGSDAEPEYAPPAPQRGPSMTAAVILLVLMALMWLGALRG